jgi:outer membrane protein assembly factor BamB
MKVLIPLLWLSVLFSAPGTATEPEKAPPVRQEWTRFRGPNGSGVSPDAVPVKWTEKDYNWKVLLPGIGHSSPVLWGERVFVTSADDRTGRRHALCLRAGDGRTLWSREFPGQRHGKHQDNSFATATPAVDERHLYLCWGGPKEILVIALNHRDGKEVWRTDLGPYRAGHGFGASPVVHDGLVIVPNDQDGPSFVAALDCDSGKVRWKAPRRGKSSYSTPCVYLPKGEGRPAELIFTNWDQGITSLDPKTGRTNWEANLFDKRHIETAIASPVTAGDLVLGACGWLGVRQEVVAVRPGTGTGTGTGKTEAAKEAYRINRAVPLCTTPLVKDDLLFLWSDGGTVTCASAATGAVHWRQRVPGSYYSSPVCAGGHVYNVSRDGDVVVLAASKRFAQVARNSLGEGSHATPAVAAGRIYFRTFSHLIAVGGPSPK